MRTALYVIWLLVPAFFFTVALYTYLEKVSSKGRRHENPGDYFKQGIFVLICVFIAMGVDQYFLESFISGIFPEWIPLGFFQVILLPVVLYGAAVIAGPTKEIRIGDQGRKPKGPAK